MNRSLWGALLAVLAVGLLATLLRRFSGGVSSVTPTPQPPDAVLDEIEDRMDDPESGGAESIAVTSDGLKFVPIGDQVQLLHPADPAAGPAVAGDGDAGPGRPGEKLSAGDFTGVRVVRGTAGFGPWRLEALGPDGEYLPFPFETEEAARAALAMLERRGIARAARGEDGNPIPPSAGDFEEARRRYEETENELAMSGDDPIDEEKR